MGVRIRIIVALVLGVIYSILVDNIAPILVLVYGVIYTNKLVDGKLS